MTTTTAEIVDTASRQIEQAHTALNGVTNALYALSRASATAIQPEPITDEPAPGSIVLLHGLTGSVYQRFHGDGLFHSTTGDVCDFATLLAKATEVDPNGVIFLIYRGVA